MLYCYISDCETEKKNMIHTQFVPDVKLKFKISTIY